MCNYSIFRVIYHQYKLMPPAMKDSNTALIFDLDGVVSTFRYLEMREIDIWG